MISSSVGVENSNSVFGVSVAIDDVCSEDGALLLVSLVTKSVEVL